MTLLLEEPTAADDQQAQLLFKEARQRRRRLRTIWITIASVVVGSLVSLGFTLHLLASPVARSGAINAPPAWPIHLRTGATLVYAFKDLRVISADSGRSRILSLPAPYGGSGDLGMVSVGNSLVLNRGNTAWLYPAGIDGAPTDLGPSEGVFSGPSRNEAWIWSQPCIPIIGCSNYNAPQMGSVHLIDSQGRQIGAAKSLPGDAGWYPTGPAGTAGIVLSELPPYGDVSPNANEEEVWNPVTGQVIHRFANAAVIGVGGNSVVWESTGRCATRCSVHVLDVQTGSDRAVRLPPGVTTTGDAAISPDGSTIAITGALRGTSLVPYPQAVLLIGLHTRDAMVLAGSEQPTNPNLGPMAISWSPGGWLFSSSVGATTVHAWHPGERRARVLPKLRLPKVPSLVNEDPSLIAL
jgi:hypothetical protein